MINMKQIQRQKDALAKAARAGLAVLDAERAKLQGVIDLCTGNGHAGSRQPRHRPLRAKASKPNSRIDWDKQVLAKLGKKFTTAEACDLGVKLGVDRNQVYPAINRWLEAKKAKRTGAGTYEKR